MCFGFDVRSSLPLRFLRAHGEGEVLRVAGATRRHDRPLRSPDLEWRRRPGYDLHARLYATETGFRFWTDREGWFDVDPPRRALAVPRDAEPVRLEERLWGVPAALCFIARGDLAVHAAAVEIDGTAILLAAPGSFGKTTLASAFLREGHRVLSEDFTCCRTGPRPAIVPGPALLRVRRDVYPHLALPETEVVLDEPDRVHLSVRPELRGSGCAVPLDGIVFLRASDTGPSLERASLDEALSNLWTLTFKLPRDQHRAACFEALAVIAAEVPAWHLSRPLRLDALADVVDAVRATVAAARAPRGAR